MGKTLQARTEEILLYCLSNNEWVDEALYQYSKLLLDMMIETPRSSKELESLIRLVSQYAMYLPRRFCSQAYQSTEQRNVSELSMFKTNMEFFLEDAFPHVPFKSNLRIKTVESYFEKIWRNGSTPSKAENNLKDLIALNTILMGRTSDEFINECYLFLDYIVDYFGQNSDFRPIGKPVLKDTTEFDASRFDQSIVYIPSQIPECKWLQYAKDYIRNPKCTGHQALQIYLYSVRRKLYIDIHVKTYIMHDTSEHYEASHKLVYKAPGGGTANIAGRLFDEYDITLLNGLHGFRSRDGLREHAQDDIGLLKPIFV
ncbi:MAG: hypothetical protein IKE91_04040 [Clostridia bacterium]|nr:hypothetical protein [Clostridia bacterium]